jgi:hypothetical protein
MSFRKREEAPPQLLKPLYVAKQATDYSRRGWQ